MKRKVTIKDEYDNEWESVIDQSIYEILASGEVQPKKPKKQQVYDWLGSSFIGSVRYDPIMYALNALKVKYGGTAPAADVLLLSDHTIIDFARWRGLGYSREQKGFKYQHIIVVMFNEEVSFDKLLVLLNEANDGVKISLVDAISVDNDVQARLDALIT